MYLSDKVTDKQNTLFFASSKDLSSSCSYWLLLLAVNFYLELTSNSYCFDRNYYHGYIKPNIVDKIVFPCNFDEEESVIINPFTNAIHYSIT